MNKKTPILIITTCALILSVVIASIPTTPIPITSPSPAATTKVYISPASILGPPPGLGESFIVGIYIEDVTNLTGWQAGLQWDPTVLACSSWKTIFRSNVMSAPANYLEIIGTIDNTTGQVYPPYSYGLKTGKTPKSGSDFLAKINFTVLDYGFTWINLTNVKVTINWDPTAIPVDVTDGTFELPGPHGPKAVKTHTPPDPKVNQTVTFNASASDPGFNGTADVPIANYTWDFDDGNTTTTPNPIIYHIYTTAATYTVNLTVTCEYDSVLDALGLLSNSTQQDITIISPPPPPPHGPKAVKTHMPPYPRVNRTVTFDASASELGWNGTADVPIANYTWDFGDENTTTVSNPVINHTYKNADVYLVNLTVTCEYDPVLDALGLLSNSTSQYITVYLLPFWFWKSNFTDYAPGGVPDFDQRQDDWVNPYPSVGTWSWCGPTAVANSLWWLDSRFDPIKVPPPTISDGFPMVQAYGPWDDHDPRNVPPFITELAWKMDTDGQRTEDPHCGTEVYDMGYGIDWYLEDKGLDHLFYERVLEAPTFWDVEEEIEICEDVILLLGFWQWNNTHWVRVGGHYVTAAGVNPGDMLIAICDPVLDRAELGGPGRVFPGPHLPGHTRVTHNNASYASQDIYTVGFSMTPGGVWGLIDYPAYMILDNIGENLPNDLELYAGGYNYTLPIYTEIEYAVVISPKGPVVHDVAISNIEFPETIYGGCLVEIYVVAENHGNLSESFIVTAYYDGNVVGTKTIFNLASRANKTLTFILTIPSILVYPYPTYIISANASIVPGEVYTVDNAYIGGIVTVKLPGDANGDGHIDVSDLTLLGNYWYNFPIYNPQLDFNMDGITDVSDLTILADNWFKGPLD